MNTQNTKKQIKLNYFDILLIVLAGTAGFLIYR